MVCLVRHIKTQSRKDHGYLLLAPAARVTHGRYCMHACRRHCMDHSNFTSYDDYVMQELVLTYGGDTIVAVDDLAKGRVLPLTTN